jgi:hypothetical protein
LHSGGLKTRELPMNKLQKALLFALALTVMVGLASAARARGLRAVARGLADQILSIRAFDVLGCGIRLIGIWPTGRSGVFAATQWVTCFYLPIVPLARRKVRFVQSAAYDASWQVVETTPLEGREVARTYVWGWVFFPLLIIGPFVLGGLIGEAGRTLKGLLRRHHELATLLEMACTLSGAILVLIGVPWFAIALYRILKWDRERKLLR